MGEILLIRVTQLKSHSAYLDQLGTCTRCPRLSEHHQAVTQTYPDYHAAPVPIWGQRDARGILIGLAPGLHGAARTGKAFVGDSSGTMLFASLHRCGLASSPDPELSRPLGIALTNVVKCLPPQNAPTVAERNNCSSFLDWEIHAALKPNLKRNRVLVCLGGFAHQALYRNLGRRTPKFAHGLEVQVSKKLWVISSFHPSRLNINTGRITDQMLDAVFQRMYALLHSS